MRISKFYMLTCKNIFGVQEGRSGRESPESGSLYSDYESGQHYEQEQEQEQHLTSVLDRLQYTLHCTVYSVRCTLLTTLVLACFR